MERGITAGVLAAWTAAVLLTFTVWGVAIWAVVKLVNHFTG